MKQEDDIRNAVETMRKGGVILYPTDTVWGIGCDATNAEAVKKYEQFAPKFKKFIEEEVTASLKAGKYDDAQTGTPATVEAIFFTSASRIQGKDGHLKYEEFKYSYP